MAKDVSFLIPSRNEKYLSDTIFDLLKNIRGDSEIIVILDGYTPEPQIITNDDRVKFIHHKESIGQRAAINEAAKLATGKYICKCDAHIAFDEGFDVKMMQDCPYDTTKVGRMYNLDVETWKPKLHKLTDYMYITSPTAEKPFRSDYYTGAEYRRVHTNPKLIDDTMTIMGPLFFMHKDRFFELGGMDEGHGQWGQMGVEVALKAVLSGGRMVVDKRTWFSHWFRGGIGFPYHISGHDVDKARKYSQDLWLNDKWDKATRKLQWVVDKFQPPTWEKKVQTDMYQVFYSHILREGYIPTWRGVRCIKLPTDLILYSQILWDNKPDILIECGTGFGGSTLFYADCFNTIGKGHVISIDKLNRGQPPHSRITYINGRMTACDTLATVKDLIKGKTVMVVLDGNHYRKQVKRELYFYTPMVTRGQFIVVEDIYRKSGLTQRAGHGGEAVDWFFKTKLSKNFKKEPIDEQFLYCISKGGWIRRL